MTKISFMDYLIFTVKLFLAFAVLFIIHAIFFSN